MSQGEWQSSTDLIEAAVEILENENPMTIRQLFYLLSERGACMSTFRRARAPVLYLQQPIAHFSDGSRGTYLLDVYPDERRYQEGLPYEKARQIMLDRLRTARPRLCRCLRCGLPLSDGLSVEAKHGPVCARKRLVKSSIAGHQRDEKVAATIKQMMATA